MHDANRERILGLQVTVMPLTTIVNVLLKHI